MAAKTQPTNARTDDQGIERTRDDNPGIVDKFRRKWPVFDHIMRMLERYGSQGGNQLAGGITYFSVLAMFPLFMLIVATAATVLANRPDLFQALQDQVVNAVEGDLGETINELLKTAVDQRGAMFGIGGLTTLWSGLGWMNNLRVGISAMWNMDANDGGGFLKKKINDLIGLIGLILALFIAFGVTALGTSGLIPTILDKLGLESFPGIDWVVFFIGLAVGLLANFLVMLCLIMILPRTKVPFRSGAAGAFMAAIALELIKQLSTVIMSSAAGNPAGAVFGPVIVLMVVMFLLWRVVLYCSAWTATTKESLEQEIPDVPEPAIIRVRNEIKQGPSTGATLGAGAAIGAVGASVIALLRNKK